MKIQIGKGSCGIAAGAGKISDYLEKRLAQEKLDIEIATTGCIGMCFLEPIVNVISGDASVNHTYVKVTAEIIDAIIDGVKSGELPERGLIEQDGQDYLNGQVRIALRNCGVIDPENIEEYIANHGYEALKKCLAMTPEAVINEIRLSGLAGRGGAGFPTWFKWQAARSAKGDVKYIICNADEGDPGAFMDRAVIEGDPHTMIEGMLISAYAIAGASEGTRAEGIIYVRAEYPLAIKRLETAIAQARDKGLLGSNILGSGFGYDLRIKAGAGAFVCGEETALIASLEGERGMPRLKPPFPAEKGFWQKPSNINNVETYANIPWIIQNGGAAFADLGTDTSKGTKVFALTGKIEKGGLVEIPMGRTIKDVIFGIGGGVKDGKEFKAVQMGGPSGGCIPAGLSGTPIDYRSITQTGAIMGSGGMVVMDETTCMVDMARFFLDFTCKESCGKCVHCRIGTKRMLEILNRITSGEGLDGDIGTLEELAVQIKEGSLCGLGQSAPNPVLTTIKYFRNEYEDHINGKCTAHSCTKLVKYSIDKEKCTGCTLCARKCPANVIKGKLKEAHEITEGCVKCGKCETVCRVGAVIKENTTVNQSIDNHPQTW